MSRRGDLYSLDIPHSIALFARTSRKASTEIWHARWGHSQQKNLRFLDNNLVDANSWLRKPSVCSSCQQGQNYRLPLTINQNIKNSPLEKSIVIMCLL